MDNPLLTSNSSFIIKRLRKKKLTTKKHLYLDRSKINELNYLQKSFNFKENNTTKNVFPSLSSGKIKYLTKSNSQASSTQDEINNEKDKKSLIKTNIFNKRKIGLKLPEKLDNLKNVRNRIIKKGNNYFKTENNQRIIFNNIGINYHKTKCNNHNIKRSLEKKDLNSLKENSETNDNLKGLIIKNNKQKKEKNDRDNKFEILEQKIDTLINSIQNNETINLKNKINSLENENEILKKENELLKNELNSKNEIISLLTKNQNRKDKINDNIKSNSIDMDKIRLISIDPDDI
jgi:hypothetical protein